MRKNDLDSTALKLTLGSILIEEEKYRLSVEGSFMLGLDGDVKANAEQNNSNNLTNAKLYVDKLYSINLKVT